MAVPFNQLEHEGVLYKPFYRMNGDPFFYQSENGHVYYLKQGVLRCAFAKFMMDGNGTAIKNLRECKKKPGARRPCSHIVTPNMESIITLWRVTRVALCHLRMFGHITDFNKGTVKRVYDYFKLICILILRSILTSCMTNKRLVLSIFVVRHSDHGIVPTTWILS